MATPSSRVNEFLTRARSLNKKPTTNQPSLTNNPNSRAYNYSPIPAKKSVSPLSHQSFSSTHEDTFSSKKAPLPPKTPKSTSKSPATKEKLLSVYSMRLPKAPIRVKEEKKEPIKEIDHAAIKEVEAKGKKKLQKVIEIFKEEALKMDAKLQSLQQENKNLNDIYNNPQLPSTRPAGKTAKMYLSEYEREKADLELLQALDDLCLSFKRKMDKDRFNMNIANWFECLTISEDRYKGFLAAASKKISIEQSRRLKTEEETGRMIEFEENLIRELEAKVSNAEMLARKDSNRVFIRQYSEERQTFDKLKQ